MSTLKECLVDRIQKVKEKLVGFDSGLRDSIQESVVNAEKALAESPVKMTEAFYDLDNWLIHWEEI